MKVKYKILYFIFFFMSIIPAVHSLKISNCIDARGLCFSWANGMNNNIRIIHFNNDTKYFKECKEKVDIKSEVQRILEEYFEEYLSTYNPYDKELLIKTLSDNENFEKFYNSGFLWERKSYLFKYINDEIDSSYLGIPTYVAEKLSIDLKDLFLYSSRELLHRHISANIKEGELQTNLAVKQLATYRLAKYLGISDVVVKSEFVKLITNHGDKIGVISNKTEGMETSELENMNLEISPSFQREITSLQVLDTITNEQDHTPENCSFKIADNKLVGIMAFDNEGGFGMNTGLKNKLCWGKTSALVTEDQKINLPHISKNLAKKILGTRDKDISNIFQEILPDNQLNSLKTRFNKIKNALANTIRSNNKLLLSDDEWNKATLSEELSGSYGNTYLLYYLKNLNLLNKQFV